MLWIKLDHYCIRGNVLNVLKNMYEKAKSCVRIDNFCTDYFPCCIGVRQGESLSPLLFSFFVNDLHEYFSQSNLVHGSVLEKHSNDDRMIEFLKLFVLLYADDTIIVAENAHDLQNALNIYENYCTVNKLTINTCNNLYM